MASRIPKSGNLAAHLAQYKGNNAICGTLLAQGATWKPHAWREWLSDPDLTEHLKRLSAIETLLGGNFITRSDVFALAAVARQTSNPDDVLTLFIASMLWGFGSSGRGPYQTVGMLRSYLVAQRVQAIFKEVTTPGRVQSAYDMLFDPKTRLCGLGASFGTKFLYFAGFDVQEQVKPLILDERVKASLKELNIKLKEPVYQTYVNLAAEHAGPLCRSDVFEYVLFI